MKYFKPRSVTWWAGIALILSGALEASAFEYPGAEAIRATLDAVYGTVGPGMRINFGIGLIGLRGALGS